MSTPILRGLAKAYSDGLIDRKRYIRERRHLIDDIVAGEVAIVPYDAPKPAADPELERTFSDGETTLEIPHVDSEAVTKPVAPAKTGRSGLLIAVIVIGAAAAYAGWRAVNPVEPEAAVTPVATRAPETPNPAAVLLENFLEENTWLPKRIEGFMLAWEQEPQTARDALADTPTMRRAADVITQQILEEKALFELGEQETALRKQRRLLDLASALSIENERITRQETEWLARQNALLAAQMPDDAEGAPEPPQSPGADPASDRGTENLTGTDNDPAPALPDAARSPSTPDEEASPPPAPDGEELATPGVAMTTPPATPSPSAETPAAASPETGTSAAETPATESAASATPAANSPPVPVPTAAAAVNAAAAGPDKARPASATGGTAESPAAANAARAPASKSSSPRKGCRPALAKQRRPYCRDSLGKNLNGPTLVVLPAGKAEIGGSKPSEQPKYTVNIERPFGLSVFEVRNVEFNAFCQATKRTCPAQPWSDPDFPVVNVSWSLATKYTEWLSELSGAKYRLPTESEWEYAARAGTRTPYPFGDEVLPTHAIFSFRGQESTPVAANDRTVNRNKFRLYHMIGNVREWVLDAWSDDHNGAAADGSARSGSSPARVARGGSYIDGADQVRSASRVRLDGDRGDAQTGFRVLREIE